MCIRGLNDPDVGEEEIALLPESIRWLAKEIGPAVLVKLALAFGGTIIYVPAKRNVKPSNKIAKEIGLHNARKLSAAFTGNRTGVEFDVPQCTRLQRHRRNQMIRRDAAHGVSRQQLAKRYEMSHRCIRRIVNSGSAT